MVNTYEQRVPLHSTMGHAPLWRQPVCCGWARQVGVGGGGRRVFGAPWCYGAPACRPTGAPVTVRLTIPLLPIWDLISSILSCVYLVLIRASRVSLDLFFSDLTSCWRLGAPVPVLWTAWGRMTIPCGGGLASVPLLGTLECSYEHRQSSTEFGFISSFLSMGGGGGEGKV